MASVGYVANSLVSAISVNLQEVLTNFGHSVTTSTQAAFGAATFSGEDVILVGPTDRDDSAFIADLDTHMDTHTVPVVVTSSDGLASGEIGRNGSGLPDTTASALGIISLERETATSPRPDPFVLRTTEAPMHVVTDGFLAGSSDTLMISEGAGDSWTELPEVADILGNVIEVASNAAGTRLMNNVDGFTSLVVADAGDTKRGSRANPAETFATKVGWFGIGGGGDDRVGKDAAAILNAMLDWASAAAPDYDVYPTAGTNGAVLAAINLEPLVQWDSGTISWTEVTPALTTVTVTTSVDDGASFSAQANGGAIAGLAPAQSLTDVRLLIKVVLASTDPAATPTFTALDVVLKGDFAPLRDGADVIRPDGYFDGGLVLWLTGNNAGMNQEIKTWVSGTRTITLFLPAPCGDIQVGDTFQIRPGCQKRLVEDCRDKFSNAINYVGEPHVPGTDALLNFPDQQ